MGSELILIQFVVIWYLYLWIKSRYKEYCLYYSIDELKRQLREARIAKKYFNKFN
jgi:hypothetical protein